MKKYSSVIITGSIGYDVIMDYKDEFINQIQPDKLHKLNLSFVVDKLEKQFGGIATNISYNLSLITKIKIKVLGAIGQDGNQLSDFFKKNKINTSGIILDNKLYSATGSVITDLKDNQIWSYCYGASILGKDIKLFPYLDKKTVMTISASHPKSMMNFQKQAIKFKVDYLYDPGLALGVITKKDLLEGIKHCRWLVENDYEIGLIEKILNISTEKMIKNFNIAIIITLGDKGVTYQDKKNYYNVPAYKVKKVIDPTGAGDAWRGGFLAGILNGKKIIDSLKLGNVMASFAIEKYGTVNHKPSKQEIRKRLKSISNY